MSTLTLQDEVAAMKQEQDKLLMLLNQYGQQLLDLEHRVLLVQQAPAGTPTVCARLRSFMLPGSHYGVGQLAHELAIPYNTVHVTLRRNPRLFRRSGWGQYTLSNERHGR